MTISTDINNIISNILVAEGGARFTNLPNDRGGPTKYGITLDTLRLWRHQPLLQAEDVEILSEVEARQIYYTRYVVRTGFIHVFGVSEPIGVEIIDSGVNCGPERAGKWLQTALNAFNRSYRNPPDYPELVVDGIVGPITVAALSTFLSIRGKVRGERVLMRALNVLQGSHYLALGVADPEQEQFMLGWFDNRIV